MLGFQFAGYLLAVFPPITLVIITLYSFIKGIIKGETPADKFAAVVTEVMKKDEKILGMKYADRWMRKALKRGLYGRRIAQYEMKATMAMPIDVTESLVNLRTTIRSSGATLQKGFNVTLQRSGNIQRSLGATIRSSSATLQRSFAVGTRSYIDGRTTRRTRSSSIEDAAPMDTEEGHA